MVVTGGKAKPEVALTGEFVIFDCALTTTFSRWFWSFSLLPCAVRTEIIGKGPFSDIYDSILYRVSNCFV